MMTSLLLDEVAVVARRWRIFARTRGHSGQATRVISYAICNLEARRGGAVY
jgi:hypothetical protein